MGISKPVHIVALGVGLSGLTFCNQFVPSCPADPQATNNVLRFYRVRSP
jgi:hypothetical protein